jgi:hypothetical protein
MTTRPPHRTALWLGLVLAMAGCGPAEPPALDAGDAGAPDAAHADAWIDAAVQVAVLPDPCPSTAAAMTLRAHGQQRGAALDDEDVIAVSSSAPGVVEVDLVDGQALLRAKALGATEVTLQGATAQRTLRVDVQPRPSPFARRVVEVAYGANAGHGQAGFPGIVLGPPAGAGANAGSLDVLSLGVGGEIVLELGVDVADGPGPDLLVFENPFVDATAGEVNYVEPAELAVSVDGVTFVAFACDPQPPWTGCAGRQPVLGNPALGVDPLDPARAGGDAFDLSALGLPRARYLRLRDVSTTSSGGTAAGFDLDAVAALHALPRAPRVRLVGPATARLGVGGVQPLRFDVAFAHERWSGVRVDCQVDDPGLVALDCRCTATGLRVGTTALRARLGDREAAVVIEVAP